MTMHADLAKRLAAAGKPKILVVGDEILDIDINCSTSRTDPAWPEANIYDEESWSKRVGGAAAVACMVEALGGVVTFVPGVQRSVKQRYILDGKVAFRVDRMEPLNRVPVHESTWTTDFDLALVADYGKGIMGDEAVRRLLNALKAKQVPIITDPANGTPWTEYAFTTAMKCNKIERKAIRGKKQLSVPQVIVTTKGADGISVHRNVNNSTSDFPGRVSQVVDVTGCGDAVLASFGVTVAAGFTWEESAVIANVTAGLKAEKWGAVPVTRDEVIVGLRGWTPSKILQHRGLAKWAAIQREAGKQIVWTNGCFDVLHSGHLKLLREARAQGDVLIAGVNSDASVRAAKGPTRPAQSEDERAAILAELAVVDAVVVFDGQHPAAMVEAVRPDVLVVGSDYRNRTVFGAESAGRVHFVERTEQSTTKILNRLAATA